MGTLAQVLQLVDLTLHAQLILLLAQVNKLALHVMMANIALLGLISNSPVLKGIIVIMPLHSL